VATLSLTEVLAAIYAQLAASAPLVAITGGRIYNHVPQGSPAGTPFPYVRFRPAGLSDWSDKGSYGYDGDIYIDAWSDKQDDSDLTTIHDYLMDALHRVPLTLPTGQNVCLDFRFFDTTVEPDGQAHHGVSRFRMLLTE